MKKKLKEVPIEVNSIYLSISLKSVLAFISEHSGKDIGVHARRYFYLRSLGISQIETIKKIMIEEVILNA